MLTQCILNTILAYCTTSNNLTTEFQQNFDILLRKYVLRCSFRRWGNAIRLRIGNVLCNLWNQLSDSFVVVTVCRCLSGFWGESPLEWRLFGMATLRNGGPTPVGGVSVPGGVGGDFSHTRVCAPP